MRYPLRVHAIAPSDDDGGRAATLTATQLARSLVRVNEVYRVADIEFVFDAETDWEPMRNTWLSTGNGNFPTSSLSVARSPAVSLSTTS